ncbi:MAG TPA: hypothetical protein EYN69_07550 [Flavobacteriales bacterium]|nr:hypothetical protein [Flavobacteriales bacterium]
MTDRIILGRKSSNEPSEYGMWISRPGADVSALVSDPSLETLTDWYGYQTEFDDSLETSYAPFVAYTASAGIPAAQDVSIHDVIPPDAATQNGWYESLTFNCHRAQSRTVPRIRRSANNTLFWLPTGKSQTIWTEFMFSDTTTHKWIPDSRSFNGTTHQVIEMRIRMHPFWLNRSDAPTSSTADFRLYWRQSPVGGAPASNIPGPPWSGGGEAARKGYSVVFPTDGSHAPYSHPYFNQARAGTTSSKTLHNDLNINLQSVDPLYARYHRFEHPTDVHADARCVSGVRFAEGGTVTEVTGGPNYKYLDLGDYKTLLGGDKIPGSPTQNSDGEWHEIEWDMSANRVWTDPYGIMEDWTIAAAAYNNLILGTSNNVPYNTPDQNDGTRPTNSDYRIVAMRFDLIRNWEPDILNPPDDSGGMQSNPPPLFEIEYLRVKKKGVPKNAGPGGSVGAGMLFNSKWSATGLIHQTGTVGIGINRHTIDGLSSDYQPVNWSDDSTTKGHVDIVPPLPYIPVVLFQRYDATGGSANTYPNGQHEFSVGLTRNDSQRWPRVRPKVNSDGTVSTAPEWSSSAGDGLINTLDYEHQHWDAIEGTTHSLADHDGANHNYTDYTSTDFATLADVSPLPFGGNIPSPSTRQNVPFLPAKNFSEFRTFAYVRAAKSYFQITCRNAIAADGMEPVLNLAPALPEDGANNQGYAAYTNMGFRTHNGSWGMFHPGALYFRTYSPTEQQSPGSGTSLHLGPWQEGQELAWDTVAHANSAWLDKKVQNFTRINGVDPTVWDAFSIWAPGPQWDSPAGYYTSLDINGVPGDNRQFTFNTIWSNYKNGETEVWDNYDQFQWRPLLSVSPVVFNGDLARPTGSLPTDGAEYPKDLNGVMNMGEQWTAERAAAPVDIATMTNTRNVPVYAPETGNPFFGKNYTTSGGLQSAFSPPIGGALQHMFTDTGIDTSIPDHSGDPMMMATADFYATQAEGLNPEQHPSFSGLTETGNTFVDDRHGSNAWSGDTGGFYPYRYMKQLYSARPSHPNPTTTSPVYKTHSSTGGEHSIDWTWKYTYGYEKWSCDGIYHPQGIVPENSEHFNNRHVDPSAAPSSNIYNQTAYIRGSANIKNYNIAIGNRARATTTAVASGGVIPTYRYWVLRIPAGYS